MPTRNIIFKLYQQGNPLTEAKIKIRLLTDGATLPDGSVPRYDYRTTSDNNGEATITVDVPESPYSWLFSCRVAANNTCTFPLDLADGSDITWEYIQNNLCGLDPDPIGPSQQCGFFFHRDIIVTDENVIIPENCQYLIGEEFTIDGTLETEGTLIVLSL